MKTLGSLSLLIGVFAVGAHDAAGPDFAALSFGTLGILAVVFHRRIERLWHARVARATRRTLFAAMPRSVHIRRSDAHA
jgi:hypothetical protein